MNSYVVLNDYDEIVVIADVGVVSGACVALGEEKEIVILEDGINGAIVIDHDGYPKKK